MSRNFSAFALIIALVALGLVLVRPLPEDQARVKYKEDAYDRVIRTGELRCSYLEWPPLLIKDPNTGAFSGIFFDVMQLVGEALGIKVVWQEEVTPATYIETLKSGRTDAFCSGDWQQSLRGKHLTYGQPLYYLAFQAYVRANDIRFDNDLGKINDPSVTIATINGEMASIIQRQEFSKAKIFELPQNADGTLMLMNVVTGKADVTFTDVATANQFMANNPGSLRMVATSHPLRLFPNVLSMAIDDGRLKQILDTATQEVISSGKMDAILKRYEQYPGSFYRVAQPYK